jgi:asparagine synthase (glutamine-hydrolysing)
MCGLCGIYSLSTIPSKKIVKNMNTSLQHRGPDSEGYYFNNKIGLGHRRLSIIDLSENGSQPIKNKNGNVIVVYNGEIYNYKPLRDWLKSRGHQFQGYSDSEIIPFLYEEMGHKFVEKLNGMFAIALYDKIKDELLLTRDRYGIKPLYYTENNDGLTFASEIKAILQNPLIKKKVNFQAIHDFISLHYVPGSDTAFANIYEVPPGAIISWKHGKINEKKYHSFKHIFSQEHIFNKEVLEELPITFDNAVSSQMISDVPISVLISGGIDSSLVAEAISRFSKNKNIPSHTMKFNDTAYDESKYAKLVAKKFGYEYNIKELTSNRLDIQTIEKSLLHFDEPFADSSLFPMYLISKEISKNNKVAFSGDGGDEIFGGYDRFLQVPLIYQARKIPNVINFLMTSLLMPISSRSDVARKIIKGLNLSRMNIHELLFSFSAYLSEEQKLELYNDKNNGMMNSARIFDIPEAKIKSVDELSRLMSYYLLSISLPGDMLKKVDMMSMMNSVEIRVPMLDNTLVEDFFNIPHNLKVQKNYAKIILRELAKKRVGNEIAFKKKWGFAVPLDNVFKGEIIDYLFDTLLSSNSTIIKLFNKKLVEDWLYALKNKSHLKVGIGRVGLYQRIIMLLSLELWFNKFRPEL